MALTVISSRFGKNSISIFFSDPVVASSADAVHGGDVLGNYTVFDPDSVDFETPSALTSAVASAALDSTATVVTITFAASDGSTEEFHPGDSVSVVIRNVQDTKGNNLDGGFAMLNGVVEPIRRATRDVEDAISYPILTEEIGYRPSPVGGPVGGGGGPVSPGLGGGLSLGMVASKAVTDVLGWKVNAADPKGFVGALTQSFILTEVEGHIESSWTPRTYAVQSDLGGGITGAQASLYMRAKDALDKSLPLLDGLYPLDPEADPEYVKALREMARSQMTEIVKELGVVGLPSILRIDTYFEILLGQNPAQTSNVNPVQFDPDSIGGTLGTLRGEYGIYFANNPFNNSIEDEQDITNFRVISDYMTSLMQSWIANRPFFVVDPTKPAFFGTQLVLISRQFNVIAETVNEVRFALDSVFIGPNERQSLLLEFADPNLLPSMFLEDVLEEVENFATNEGPRLLRDGGKISVTNNIIPVMNKLLLLVQQARDPQNIADLPDGYRTVRVRHSLDDLGDQIDALIELTEQVEQQVPPPEGQPIVNSVTVSLATVISITILGNQLDSAVEVIIDSTPIFATVNFFSSQKVVATVDPAGPPALDVGSHGIVVVNPSGLSTTVEDAFTWTGTDVVAGISAAVAAKKSASLKKTSSVKALSVRPLRSRQKAKVKVLSKTAQGAGGAGGGGAAQPAGGSSALSGKIASLESGHDDLVQSHAALLQEVKSLGAKLAGFIEGKKGSKKDDVAPA